MTTEDAKDLKAWRNVGPVVTDLLTQTIRERDEARRLARLFWHWSIWLDHEMNAAFCAGDIEDLERLRVGDGGKYEEWRRVREAGKPDWLKETP